MERWQDKARLVAATAAITSVAWIVGIALWLDSRDHRAATTGLTRPVALPVLSQPHRYPARPAQRARAMAMPVEGVRGRDLVDTFTAARAGGQRVHDAIDIMAPLGTPVRAALPGKVEKLFLSGDGGNTIYVRTDDGYLMTYYAHLDAYAAGLAEGQHVRQGQVIATVGVTGNADPAAPHLHFALLRTTPDARWDEGEAVNPFPLLRSLP